MNEPQTSSLEIDPTEVRRQLDAGEGLHLLDCRTEGEWEIARIENARLIPLQEISLRMEELEDWRQEPIVVYCHKGARSMVITRLLRHVGFDDVRSMAGGIDRWSREVDDKVATY